MRVTSAVREYVRKVVLGKVQARYDAAKKAAEEASAASEAKVEQAKEIAKKIADRAQAEFVKECKRRLGLTWVPDTYNHYGELNEKNGNYAFGVSVGEDDFRETMSDDKTAAKANPSRERDRIARIRELPGKIREAANAAADKLLFDLELGKVAKKELDEMLRGLEVEI